MNKKQQGMVWMYENATYNTLDEAYQNPSEAKRRAYRDCLAMCDRMGGYDVRITGKSCMFFSIAWRFENNGEEWLHYETYANGYEFPIK